MTPKHNKINTIQDIINVITSENIDTFLNDFEAVVRSALLIKETTGITPQTDGFTWIDDGKNDITIKIKEI